MLLDLGEGVYPQGGQHGNDLQEASWREYQGICGILPKVSKQAGPLP